MWKIVCSDYLFKLLLIGDSGVGKSCLLLRFAVSYSQLVLVFFFFLSQRFNFSLVAVLHMRNL